MIPAQLNQAGQDFVLYELNRLGLEWSLMATVFEIEGKPGFQNLEQGFGDTYDYEISNVKAGLSSYGVFANITIEADKHVIFEEG